MKGLIRIVITVLVIYPVLAIGQDGTLWKGLMFDKTTSEEAIAIVGKPKKRRSDRIKSLDSPGGKVIGKQEIHIIEFEKIDGWEKISLSFFKDRLFNAKFGRGTKPCERRN